MIPGAGSCKEYRIPRVKADRESSAGPGCRVFRREYDLYIGIDLTWLMEIKMSSRKIILACALLLTATVAAAAPPERTATGFDFTPYIGQCVSFALNVGDAGTEARVTLVAAGDGFIQVTNPEQDPPVVATVFVAHIYIFAPTCF